MPTYNKLRRSDDQQDRKHAAAGSTVSAFDERRRVSTQAASQDASAAQVKPMMMVILAWLSMILAVMSGSAIGPAFKWFEQHNIHELLAASWRCQVMAIILIPLAFIEARYFNHPWHWLTYERKPDLKYPVAWYILAAGAAWALNLTCWIIGLEYTTTVRASIFSGMHPLMLVFYMFLSGKPVSMYEWCGVLLSFLGLLFIALFSEGLLYKAVLGSSHRGGKTSVANDQSWIGDLLCLLASAAEVVVIVNRDRTKQYVPVIQYTALTTICVAISTTVSASFYTSATFFCSADNCLFGWASPRWLLTMTIFGFVVGVICVGGFNFSQGYINPLVFSCVLLVDPAVTAVISFLIGVEGTPDIFTICGGLIVVAGVALVTIGERESSRSADDAKTSFQMVRLHDDIDDDEIWDDSCDPTVDEEGGIF